MLSGKDADGFSAMAVAILTRRSVRRRSPNSVVPKVSTAHVSGCSSPSVSISLAPLLYTVSPSSLPEYVLTCQGQKGTFQPIRLFKAKSIAIERHVKIQSAANPYDPEGETYFEKRLDVKMAHNLKGKRQRLYLWKPQGGLCPLCTRKITKLTYESSRIFGERL